MKPPEPDEEEPEDEAEEADGVQPGFWLLQILRDLAGGPDEDTPE